MGEGERSQGKVVKVILGACAALLLVAVGFGAYSAFVAQPRALDEARGLLSDGDYDGAERVLEELVSTTLCRNEDVHARAEETLVGVRETWASESAAQGDWALAIRLWEQTNNERELGRAHKAYADELLEQGDRQAALEQLRLVPEASEQVSELSAELCSTYMAQGDFLNAVRCYRDADQQELAGQGITAQTICDAWLDYAVRMNDEDELEGATHAIVSLYEDDEEELEAYLFKVWQAKRSIE